MEPWGGTKYHATVVAAHTTTVGEVEGLILTDVVAVSSQSVTGSQTEEINKSTEEERPKKKKENRRRRRTR